MTKVALSLRTWATAYVREPKHAYAGTFVWEPLQTPFFPLYKALYGTFSKYIEIPREKPKIHQKIVDQKGVFHKTPLSHFYFIGTFFYPNHFSLTLLITILLNCDKFD